MRKIWKSEDGSGSGRALVSEFILSKGKEVEESWAFREIKETQLSKYKEGQKESKRKDGSGPGNGGGKGVCW